VLTADRDHGVEGVGLDRILEAVDRLLTDRLEARGAEDRPAERENPADGPHIELHVVAFGQPLESAHDSDRLVARGDRRAGNGANHGVEARAVAAGCQHSDPHPPAP